MAHSYPSLDIIFALQESDAGRHVLDMRGVRDISVSVRRRGGGCGVRGVGREAVVEGCDTGEGGGWVG
jgi:hypothetical protein